MEEELEFRPFGTVEIPPLAIGRLGACFQASDWATLNKAWHISMYQAFPLGQPVDRAGKSVDMEQEPHHPKVINSM